MHFRSSYYYFDYEVIDVLTPSWLTEILFGIGLLLAKEVKQLQIIIIIMRIITICYQLKYFLVISSW